MTGRTRLHRAPVALAPAGGRHEREADRAAARLVGPVEHGSDSRHALKPAGRRGGTLDPRAARAIIAARGSGQPLPDGLRRRMEQAFGADFGAVRVHTDHRADTINQVLGSRAATSGQDIFLGRGEHYLGGGGQKVVAHELAHVRQQAVDPTAAGSVQRLVRAAKFRKKTKLAGRKGKSHAAFSRMAAGLQAYETHGNVRELEGVYRQAREWLQGPRAGLSSRTKYVQRLLPELKAAGLRDYWRDRARAKKRIAKSSLPDDFKRRANYLIDDPDGIDQTAFGVCGMVSILRPLAEYQPVKFADLAIRALDDPRMDYHKWADVFDNNAEQQHVDDIADFDFLVAQWLIRFGASGEVSQTALERTAGGVQARTATKRYSAVFQQQREFSERFGIAGWEEQLGHFAMTTGGLNYLLTAAVDPESSHKIKIQDFWADYQLARHMAGTYPPPASFPRRSRGAPALPGSSARTEVETG